MAVRDKKKQTETGFITAGDRYLFLSLIHI